MMRFIRAILTLLITSRVAGAQLPNVDIFLAPLSRVGDSIVVGAAINVTHRPGYDNQPSFLPDSRTILYTAIGGDGQADIWRYDIGPRTTTRVTTTPESEYSATPMPGGRRLSVVRVEHDSTQRLWSFALDGSDAQLVLPLLKPVGYHAWLDSTHLVTYVLGTPSTLHLVSLDGSMDVVRARDIGRAVHRVPTEPAFTYTQRDSGVLWITRQPIDRLFAERLARAPADNEFHAFMPDGTLLTASGGKLLRWNKRLEENGSAWIPIADLSVNAVRNVSRLAVSPDGRWLAFVAEPVP